MPPDFTILLVVPVHRILLVAFPPAGRQFYPFPVLIKVINLAALGKPFPMFVHCPHSEQDMGVGIVSRRMGVMDGKVNDHAFGNKLLLAKLPDKDSVLVGRYLSGDGKHPPPCKLGVPLLLHASAAFHKVLRSAYSGGAFAGSRISLWTIPRFSG